MTGLTATAWLNVSPRPDDDTQAVKAAVATFHDTINTLFTGDAYGPHVILAR
jgi:hypothetical protein